MSWASTLAGRAGNRLHKLSPRSWLWISYLGLLLYAFPGYMSNDSVLQLVEARSHLYSNPHPPIMAAEWTVIDQIIAGPLLMLMLQGALFLLGLAAILRRVMSPRAAAICASCVLWFPPVLSVMGVVWKDCQMAGYLMAGTALLTSDDRRRRLAGLVAITLGCAFRYNAFAAVVPLVLALFTWRPGMRWWLRYPIALAASIGVVGASFAITHVLTRQDLLRGPTTIDIVGMVTFSHDRSDDELRELLRGTPLRLTDHIQDTFRERYSARNAYWIDHGDDRVFDISKTSAQVDASQRAWKALFTSDPGSYFEYRLSGFAELVGYTDDPPWSPIYNAFLESQPDQMNYIDHNASLAELQASIARVLSLLSETMVYRPYLYIAIALLLLGLCCRDRLTFALLGSGLTYELSFFPAGGTPDFRYSHWMIVTTCVVIVLLFVQRLRGVKVAVP